MAHIHLSTAGIIKATLACGMLGGIYVQPFRPMFVVGHSMEPTYANMSFSWTEPVSKGGLKPGDVVVIDMEGTSIVKRIAFLPGDKYLQTKINNVWVDTVDLDRRRFDNLGPERFRDATVPPGMVYVLGDNKAVSQDSREFGCVPLSRVESKLTDQRPSSRW